MSASNDWDLSWKRMYIEWLYLTKNVVLYPNFRNQTSFSTNHLEAGVHIGTPGSLVHRPQDYTVPLFGATGRLHRVDVGLHEDSFVSQLPGGVLPPLSALPLLDIRGVAITWGGL